MTNMSNVSIAAGGCLPQPHCHHGDGSNPTHASTSMQGGQAVFENDNYRISMGDNNTVNIHNKHTGETYEAWGDPHMKVDGQQAFDFWGTTTLALEDGTKVTIDTTPMNGNDSVTLSSRVTITNGDYGVQVSGVDTNKVGDLKIDEAKGWGHTLDWAISDGNVLHENPAGKGFVAVDDKGNVRKVDQQYINETDLMKGGAKKLIDRHENAFRHCSGLMAMSFVGGFLSGFAHGLQHDGGNHGGPRDNDGCDRGHHRPHHGHHNHHHHHDRDIHIGLSLNVSVAFSLMRF